MIDIKKITKTWEEIQSEIDNPGKYSRNIFIESKTLIRASVIYENKFKSIDFIFKKKIINKIDLEFKETKGIKVIFEEDDLDNELIILSIYLKNTLFLDTYIKLLEKIINAVFEIDDQKISYNKILKLLINWRRCFEDEKFDGLSKEEEIGLIGELTIIEKLFSKNIDPNNILSIWEGPSGGLHDFKDSKFLIEVKTFSKKKKKIKINNIDQLNYLFFTKLYLGCVELEHNTLGETLLNVIDRINNDIFHERNLNEIFEEKLNQYGYFDIHRNYYQTKFIVNKTSFYKVSEGFPTILKKNILEGISDISFSIDIDKIKNFHTNENFLN